MTYQEVFERYEVKYCFNREEKEELKKIMKTYMQADSFGKSTIRNLYFDTEDSRLIRQSMENTPYKEKLRVRSYQRANRESVVFVELKKKYNQVIYKRRVDMEEKDAMRFLLGQAKPPYENQIIREIAYTLSYYQDLKPAVFLSYDREAFYGIENPSFRMTLDENILFRERDLSLQREAYGTPILEEGMVILEVKTSDGLPGWLLSFLEEHKKYSMPFSKYKKAYELLKTREQEMKNYGFVS